MLRTSYTQGKLRMPATRNRERRYVVDGRAVALAESSVAETT